MLDHLSEVAPPVHDPFAGGGSIPLEAQRFGLRSIATDLNPVAVLINKALIQIPPTFAGRAPVGPQETGIESQMQLSSDSQRPVAGLAEDVRRYGAWMRQEAYARIGHLYPKVQLEREMGGELADVITLIWARTVESPNPAFRGVQVPLVRSFILESSKGSCTWIEPVFSADRRSYRFEIREGPKPPELEGTVRRSGGTCLASGEPIPFKYIREQGRQGRLETRLLAIVAKVGKKRVYLSPTKEMEEAAETALPRFKPELEISHWPGRTNVVEYGQTTFGDLFTPRQLVLLSTLSDMVLEVRKIATRDALAAGWDDDGQRLEEGGQGATAYGDAIATYMSLVVARMSDRHSSNTCWDMNPSGYAPKIKNTFSRQALPMVWDFTEGNPFSSSSGNLAESPNWIARVLETAALGRPRCSAYQASATDVNSLPADVITVTDPPYYDNIGYADLSDFFYVWHKRSLSDVYPRLFATIAVPKAEELIAKPYRHGGQAAALEFFQRGMLETFSLVRERSVSGLPIVVFYAFKQKEQKSGVSTGWETFLQGLLDSGFAVVGTWPVRTESVSGLKGRMNALASSIVLVCRKRGDDAPTIARGDFRRLLKQELPHALESLQHGNIAPVDMVQASLGPGMAVFSRNKSVLEADGSPMTVRSALQLIYEVSDEVTGEEEGEFDRDTRFAVTWFETYGYDEGPYGEAEKLATARAVSVSAVQAAGLLQSRASKVRLLTRDELPKAWDPRSDSTLTVWEATQHLISRLSTDGEEAAAALLTRLGPMSDQARSLAYRLFAICERRGWVEEAKIYNGLVLAWSELEKLAGRKVATGPVNSQTELFE